jgi:hypothetical protein
MKQMLEHLLNQIQREELELLFGEGSKIKIDSVSYSTNNKNYVIHSTVFVNNIEESVESFPDGLDFLISEGWKYTGLDDKITIVNRIDIL